MGERYVKLGEGEIARTEELVPGQVLADFDKHNNLVGVEILVRKKAMNVAKICADHLERWADTLTAHHDEELRNIGVEVQGMAERLKNVAKKHSKELLGIIQDYGDARAALAAIAVQKGHTMLALPPEEQASKNLEEVAEQLKNFLGVKR